METELAALTARARDTDVDALVKTGLDDGRLLPAQETRARVLGKKDIAALRAYIDTTTPLPRCRARRRAASRRSPPKVGAGPGVNLSLPNAISQLQCHSCPS